MGPILYCGPSACVVWLRPESDGKQQESPCYFQSTFCLLSVCLFLFTHILSHWWLGCGQGDSQSPSFLSPASSSGPVKNSLVILGFRSFVVGPQFKTTFFFLFFFSSKFSQGCFLKPHPHQTELSKFPLCAQHAIIAALPVKVLAVKVLAVWHSCL